MKCMNCHNDVEKLVVFQGVPICPICDRVVERALEKARSELQMVFTTYLETIRVALVKGTMNLPTLAKQGDQREAQEVPHGNHPVRPLRGPA